jgi:hypothetical protein
MEVNHSYSLKAFFLLLKFSDDYSNILPESLDTVLLLKHVSN